MAEIGSHGARIKGAILSAGLALWPHVTARAVGARVGLTHSAVLYHFGTTDDLRAAVAAEAVRLGHAGIVPQLITANDPAAAGISPERRREYLAGC